MCSLRAVACLSCSLQKLWCLEERLARSRCYTNPWWMTSQLQRRAILWACDPLVPDAPGFRYRILSCRWPQQTVSSKETPQVIHAHFDLPQNWDKNNGSHRQERKAQTISGNSETASWLWDILLTETVLILLQIAGLYWQLFWCSHPHGWCFGTPCYTLRCFYPLVSLGHGVTPSPIEEWLSNQPHKYDLQNWILFLLLKV